jgi:hypothetical protein
MRLPLTQPASPMGSIPELQRELRELEFHPERHRDKIVLSAAETARVDQLIESKLRWVYTPKSPENAGERHQRISAANHELSLFLNNRRDVVENEIVAARQAANAAKIRNSREFAYCLFPPAALRDFFDGKNLTAS